MTNRSTDRPKRVSKPTLFLADDVPRYLRCYDNGGTTSSRYTVCFTGRYKSARAGCYRYICTDEAPFHPNSTILHRESACLADRPKSHQFGRPIPFQDLPHDCQALIVAAYCDLWEALPPAAAPLPAHIDLRPDQVEALERWLSARAGAPGWLDGYPLGRSYIDSRTRGGLTYHARKAYVRLDHATARMVPELAGRTGEEIRAHLRAIRRPPTALRLAVSN